MASILANRAGMATATSGTGTVTLGAALGAVAPNICSYLSFANAGITNGVQVSYLILDSNGAWEVGTGTYTSAGTTLSRTPTASSNGGAAINLSGSAQVFLTVRAEELLIGGLGSTDNAALRADGTSGLNAQGSALLIADTTGALSRSGGGGIPLEGTNTNDNAAAGYVGEYTSANVNSASAIALTTTIPADVTSISLTAGDWIVWGIVALVSATTTTLTRLEGWASSTSATRPTPANNGTFFSILGTITTGNDYTQPIGMMRQSLSATTTVYLSVRGDFGTSTLDAYGFIAARRVR